MGAAALTPLINSTENVNVRLKPLLKEEDIDEAGKKTRPTALWDGKGFWLFPSGRAP